MEVALATKRAKTRSLLAAAVWQVLLLIALSYSTGYMVPACFEFASRHANIEPRSSVRDQAAGPDILANLVCAPSAPWPSDRSACNSPK